MLSANIDRRSALRPDRGGLGDAESWEIIKLIAKEKNVPLRLLVNPSRCRQGAAKARQLAMYLVHVSLGRSLAEVGAIFGRDRTTVAILYLTYPFRLSYNKDKELSPCPFSPPPTFITKPLPTNL
ncbi:helix-turn-helix domain-containing protein [Devosia sp.]|uniref:helix-turn-helix domain-containing protein n=1 Tax=Devosia sp. TaxID=1871048 RepID=UPI00326615C8